MSPRPVLLLIFNRPDTTVQVLKAISSWDISTLYIAADGARGDRPDEAALCETTRNLATEMSSHLQVVTLFRDENLGCGRAVAEAISWFFLHEEAGIILEDDCLPAAGFYNFCDQMLERYTDDQRIALISGTCHYPRDNSENHYRFTTYPHIWGWATWRRAWAIYPRYFDSTTAEFENALRISTTNRRRIKKFWREQSEQFNNGRIDTWDYPWLWSRWLNGMTGIQPVENLVANIGFAESATHTLRSPKYIRPTSEVVVAEYPDHPYVIEKDVIRWTEDNVFSSSLVKRIAIRWDSFLKLKASRKVWERDGSSRTFGSRN